MGYSETISWMFGLERFGIKLGLDNMKEFMSRVGNPHANLRSIHVTGTNGKGSVCTFASSVLRAHGLRTGLYISPHLVDFRERISINGRLISERDTVRYAEELRPVMDSMAEEDREEQLTFFEFTTGMAFRYFADKDVDIVVAEVGMGGRLDATNVLTPDVAAITRIGLEHTTYLGETIPEIAREKAGIIKPGAIVVTCEKNPRALKVIESTCEKNGATLRTHGKDFRTANLRQAIGGTTFDYFGGRSFKGMRTRLIGRYQAENAATAIAMIECLEGRGTLVSEEEVRKGLDRTVWPGRLDVVSRRPLLILDGSHNPEGVIATVGILEDLGITPLTFVLGCMDDKDYRGIASALAPHASRIVCTQVKNKRALSVDKLSAAVREVFQGEVESYQSSHAALESAVRRNAGRGVCAIGSLYLVGEAIPWWRERRGKGAR
jgi:dihydrofolate synthase/folylpolyglutamate synthase